MKTLLVRYTTTEESAAANAALVRAVFDELRALAPGGLRYASYQLGDGRTFLHLASISPPSSRRPPIRSSRSQPSRRFRPACGSAASSPRWSPSSRRWAPTEPRCAARIGALSADFATRAGPSRLLFLINEDSPPERRPAFETDAVRRRRTAKESEA